jgi:hypothetical protein
VRDFFETYRDHLYSMDGRASRYERGARAVDFMRNRRHAPEMIAAAADKRSRKNAKRLANRPQDQSGAS